MNQPQPTRMSYGQGILLTVLAVAAAVAVGVEVYLPERAARIRLERDVHQLHARMTRLRQRHDRMALARAELEAKEPEAVRDAIRDVLRKGAPGSYIVAPGENE